MQTCYQCSFVSIEKSTKVALFTTFLHNSLLSQVFLFSCQQFSYHRSQASFHMIAQVSLQSNKRVILLPKTKVNLLVFSENFCFVQSQFEGISIKGRSIEVWKQPLYISMMNFQLSIIFLPLQGQSKETVRIYQYLCMLSM